jgi:DNA mismatch repair protein MutL
VPIRRLPTLLVNQIAAGEVVERPASVVKELLENALDAGSSRISVTIDGGGIDRIEVSDDGGGIAAEELALAVTPHATSKISELDDLERISTLGFRGEALASIASVSEFSIRSRRRDDAHASRLDVVGGEAGPVRPDAGPPGTMVSVRHLFLNAPARRKFLKSPTTETTRIAEVVRTIALARPDVAFSLEIDGRLAIDCPATAEAAARVVEILGRESAPSLVEVAPSDEGVRVWGFIGKPELAKGTSRSQRLFLNGRAIHDRLVLHAVREGFRGLMPGDRHPLSVLFIEVEPSEVDVNVHPAKTEVRFRTPEAVHAAVRRGVRAALAGADLVPELRLGEPPAPSPQGRSAFGLESPRTSGQARLFGASGGGGPRSSGGGERSRSGPRGFDFAAMATAIEQSPACDATAADESADGAAFPARRRVLQVASSFLLSEEEDALVIVDQHALHERLMFESLRSRILSGPLESQRLLVPHVVPMGSESMTAIEDASPLLVRLGFEIEVAGERRLAIVAAPTLLASRGVDAAAFVVELLERWIEQGPVPDEAAALEDVLAMMACKSSVRAGESLSESEAIGLFERALEVERASNCPHGRPTTLRIPWGDLRRRFGRSS